VVVRYFGGTLLGVPGLIHAYKESTAQALAIAEVVEKNVEIRYTNRINLPQNRAASAPGRFSIIICAKLHSIHTQSIGVTPMSCLVMFFL
jgi:hypothetical protein